MTKISNNPMPPKNLGAMAAICTLSTILLSAGGCVSSSTGSSSAALKEMRSIAGTVASVNSGFGHIVVDCEVPPAPGTRAEIYRGSRKVGEARFSGKSQYPYAIADILAGDPRKNDILIYTP